MSEAIFDSKGYPICKGDLLRTFHFRGARRKKHYLYHTVVEENGQLFMVPTAHLEPTSVSGGGKCLIKYQRQEFEIIHGYGPTLGTLWYERTKREESQ